MLQLTDFFESYINKGGRDMEEYLEDRVKAVDILQCIEELEALFFFVPLNDFRFSYEAKEEASFLIRKIGKLACSISPRFKEKTDTVEWDELCMLPRQGYDQYMVENPNAMADIILEKLPVYKAELEKEGFISF